MNVRPWLSLQCATYNLVRSPAMTAQLLVPMQS